MANSSLALLFPAVGGRDVVGCFDGGDVTSDAGLLLVRAADRKLGLTDALCKLVQDRRQASKVEHTIEAIIRERVFAIVQGYEDANDLDRLRGDSALKVACELRPGSGTFLASQPTISRLENAVSRKDVLRMGMALAERVVAQLPRRTRHVVLDVDATPDPCHGQQEFEMFNGHYGCHCYLPLHLYVTGPDGVQRLLASLLRAGNSSYKAGLLGLLRMAVRLLRRRFPGLRITLRSDAGFGYADVLAFCEKYDLGYVLGLSSNKRLAALSTLVQMDTAIKHSLLGDDAPEYAELAYKADTWPHKRRVVVKVEVAHDPLHSEQQKLNARYVVTDRQCSPERVYRFYCARGDCENRIKESKLDCFSGRTSCHRFMANQLRLLLHTAAYVLMQTLQEAAEGTQWARAQAGTLRVRLLKVAARVVESCRRIWFHLPSSFPNQEAWRHMHRMLSVQAT
jgi:hypothetical protein